MRESDDGSGEVTLTNGMAKEYAEETNYDGSVTYRFTLRSTARWSDGEKVTADDFVYAWQRLADPATDSPNHALMTVRLFYRGHLYGSRHDAAAPRPDGERRRL